MRVLRNRVVGRIPSGWKYTGIQFTEREICMAWREIGRSDCLLTTPSLFERFRAEVEQKEPEMQVQGFRLK